MDRSQATLLIAELGQRLAVPDMALSNGSCLLSLDDGAVVCGARSIPLPELFESVPDARHRMQVMRKAYGSPRTTCFNVHGFRIAVHRITGEIRILYSVHAADPGVVINPQQVRGQIEGGVAQAIGFVLTENFHVDDNGVMINPNLRNYRIPTYADIPRTEVLLVETHDSVGPMKSKGIAESNVNPVALRRSAARAAWPSLE